MYEADLTEHDITCTRCGGEAVFHFTDEAKEMVEIACPDCGRYEMTRADAGLAEFDISVPEERRE